MPSAPTPEHLPIIPASLEGHSIVGVGVPVGVGLAFWVGGGGPTEHKSKNKQSPHVALCQVSHVVVPAAGQVNITTSVSELELGDSEPGAKAGADVVLNTDAVESLSVARLGLGRHARHTMLRQVGEVDVAAAGWVNITPQASELELASSMD
ncbi:unnamed protein product [Prorocentrum cordatum]|uniref:Altered inheritance of mitochondria protein 24, mitochondrial n=1 Tax=Prorocentrum cordatum TaxID=2364126 RepID=A0ABN9VH55_9DINO|nr:unnamed protein product [Polarella glacialis]